MFLKTEEGKIVGVGTITYENERLGRAKEEKHVLVLEEYEKGEKLLEQALEDK